MAGSVSLDLPAGDCAGIRVSARRSWMNFLYGSFLQVSGQQLKYGFTDLNLTAQWQLSPEDRLWLDGYWGNDGLSGSFMMYDTEGGSDWYNGMGALHWMHVGDGWSLRQSAYFTSWGMGFAVLWNGIDARLESALATAGYKAEWKRNGWSAGLESAHHWCQPQNPSVTGQYNTSDMSQPRQTALENTLWGRYSFESGPFTFEAGLKGSIYLSPEKEWFKAIDPDIMLGWNFYRLGQLALRLGGQHQYLFQTGMTDLGMPSEFWLLAGKYGKPQSSKYSSLSYLVDFLEGQYTFSAEAYYRLLDGQIEYKGTLMDFAAAAYSLDKSLLKGEGRAYGLNASVSKVSGPFTGWVSYAWGRSLRRFDGQSKEYPSAHERIHELDALASYRIGEWSFGASMVFATGTPFTAPEYLYIISSHVMAWYGEHNSRRLKPYFRTDVSVNYFFREGSGINFSLYNVTGRDNELYYRIKKNREEDGMTFSYGPASINIKYMPSVGYFHKF